MSTVISDAQPSLKNPTNGQNSNLSLIGGRLSGESLLVQTVVVLLGVLVLAALAQVKVYLPYTPVPVTGQSLGVILIAALLGKKHGPIAVIAYVLAGVFGLPIFAGGAAGHLVIAGATGGYIIGFIISGFLVGYLADKGWAQGFWKCLGLMVIAKVPIMAIGVLWLGYRMGYPIAIYLGFAPFVPGMIAKIIVATGVLQLCRKAN